jgi:hypothetical protein
LTTKQIYKHQSEQRDAADRLTTSDSFDDHAVYA